MGKFFEKTLNLFIPIMEACVCVRKKHDVQLLGTEF